MNTIHKLLCPWRAPHSPLMALDDWAVLATLSSLVALALVGLSGFGMPAAAVQTALLWIVGAGVARQAWALARLALLQRHSRLRLAPRAAHQSLRKTVMATLLWVSVVLALPALALAWLHPQLVQGSGRRWLLVICGSAVLGALGALAHSAWQRRRLQPVLSHALDPAHASGVIWTALMLALFTLPSELHFWRMSGILVGALHLSRNLRCGPMCSWTVLAPAQPNLATQLLRHTAPHLALAWLLALAANLLLSWLVGMPLVDERFNPWGLWITLVTPGLLLCLALVLRALWPQARAAAPWSRALGLGVVVAMSVAMRDSIVTPASNTGVALYLGVELLVCALLWLWARQLWQGHDRGALLRDRQQQLEQLRALS